MLYLGVDVHIKWLTIMGFDKETGELFQFPRVENDPEAIAQTFAQLPSPRCGAMEAGTISFSLHRMLRQYFDQLIIVAPHRVWDRRRGRRAKTDRLDALGLAEKLAEGSLQPLYLPDDTTRAYRSLGRGRIQTAQAITKQVNQIYALVRSWGERAEKKLLTKGGRDWLDTISLPEPALLVLEQKIERLDALLAQQALLDKRILAIVKQEPICQLLMTIPYVGPLTALVLRAELGDIHRFPSADNLVGYIGLDPRTFQSSDSCHYGHLSKQGNSYLRHVAVLYAQHVVQGRRDTPFKRRFYRLCHAHHPNEIKVMLARDFLAVVRSIWRKGTPWQWPRETAQSKRSAAA